MLSLAQWTQYMSGLLRFYATLGNMSRNNITTDYSESVIYFLPIQLLRSRNVNTFENDELVAPFNLEVGWAGEMKCYQTGGMQVKLGALEGVDTCECCFVIVIFLFIPPRKGSFQLFFRMWWLFFQTPRSGPGSLQRLSGLLSNQPENLMQSTTRCSLPRLRTLSLYSAPSFCHVRNEEPAPNTDLQMVIKLSSLSQMLLGSQINFSIRKQLGYIWLGRSIRWEIPCS